MVPLEPDSYRFLTIFNFTNFVSYLPLLILLVFLLVASAFFSSAETAFSSVNIIRLRNYVEEKKKGAKKALYIAEKFDLTLTTLLIGNNLVNIAATTIAAYILTRTILDPTISSIINTVVMTVIILIFGEIMPKSYSKENAEKVALRYSGPLYFIIKMFYPLSWLLLKLKKAMFKKTKSNSNSPYVTEDELESIIDVMENEGVIEKDDAELLQSAIGLNEITVYDIMTPRVDVIAIEINDSIESIKDRFFEYQFSRMPVYENDKDNILGILSERDFLTAYIKLKPENIDIHKLISKPIYVSKSTKVDDLIREMQKLKKHFAVVSDEYGGTSGIVTMEDALEELVGEIYDEYDEYNEEMDQEKIVELAPNKYLITAEMSLEFLFETLHLGDIPESIYSTVGGYVYEMCEETPYTGKQIHFHAIYENDDFENPIKNEYDVVFTIEVVQNRRIKTIVVETILLEDIE
ncbi:MAG: hemolysin family protein [Bacilli bacterium]|nr:hemolysin family protein [Bacilli bacterium]